MIHHVWMDDTQMNCSLRNGDFCYVGFPAIKKESHSVCGWGFQTAVG